jgi:hypothetical protein
MTTEQITEDRVDETVELQETELEGEYRRPAISIIRHQQIGEASESTRVEIERVQDFPTTGDLVVFVEGVLHALAGTKRPGAEPTYKFTVQPISGDVASGIAKGLARLRRPATPKLSAEDLEEELRQAEEHDKECSQDHTTWLHNLRDLILQARADKAAAGRAAAEPGDSGDLADAAVREASEPAAADNTDTCPGGC